MKQYEHYCKYCGKLLERVRFPSGRLEDFSAFKRRLYCNRKCMRMGFMKIGSYNQAYRVAHQTAVRIMDLLKIEKKCVKCGKTKNIDVHHKDENYQNNNMDNLEYLCRSCHMKKHRPKGVCKICGEPQKGYGYCNKHYIRFKKYGDPLYTKYKTEERDSDLLLCKDIDTEFTFKMSKKAHHNFLKAVCLITPRYKKIKKGKRYIYYEIV